jgi:hypothetical protein
MSLFAQDVFAEAKALGLTVGFVGTYAELKELVFEATAPVDPDEDGSLAFARWAEGGWHGGRYTDEEAEDRARNPFDPQGGYSEVFFDTAEDAERYDRAQAGLLTSAGFKPLFTAENDPDGEAENAWHEQQGERAAEAKASAWFAFPGDR